MGRMIVVVVVVDICEDAGEECIPSQPYFRLPSILVLLACIN